MDQEAVHVLNCRFPTLELPNRF